MMSGPWNPPDASKGDSIGLAAVGGMKPDPAVGKRDLFLCQCLHFTADGTAPVAAHSRGVIGEAEERRQCVRP